MSGAKTEEEKVDPSKEFEISEAKVNTDKMIEAVKKELDKFATLTE